MSRRYDLECDDAGWLSLVVICDGDYECMRVLGPIEACRQRVPSALEGRYEAVLAEWMDRIRPWWQIEADYRRAKL